MTPFDPYQGNILVEKLGQIKSRKEISTFLTYLPKLPPNNVESIPRHIRLHMLQDVRDLHIPSLNEARLSESMDLMLRQSYKYRDPKDNSTWSNIYASAPEKKTITAPPMVMGVSGHAGVGKTQSIRHSLSGYRQIIIHEKFPRVVNELIQVVWISIDVPSSGRSEHLAMNLMNAWDHALASHLDSYAPRFTEDLRKSRLDGPRMLNDWRKVATSHFLGILHLDEAQNLLPIKSLKERNANKSGREQPLKLSIKEIECLKWILSLSNTWNLSVMISCTPDGINAFNSRFSNLQRFISFGLHTLKRFESADDPQFKDVFFPCLFKYQFVKDKLVDINQVGKIVIQLSGGIQRIIIALWIAAHRVAFEREKNDALQIDDFIDATKIYLAPLATAIKAINSGEPSQMSAYEDMIGDEGFWDAFWNSVAFLD